MFVMNRTRSGFVSIALVAGAISASQAAPPPSSPKTESSPQTASAKGSPAATASSTTDAKKPDVLNSPEAKAMAEELKTLFNHSPDQLAKLGLELCASTAAELRYGREIVKIEQAISNLSECHAMTVSERNAAEAELERHRSELQAKIVKLTEQLSERPQDRDRAIQRLAISYRDRIQTAQAKFDRSANQIRKIDERFSHLRASLDDQRLERELHADISNDSVKQTPTIVLPNWDDLLKSPVAVVAKKDANTGDKVDLQATLKELGVSLTGSPVGVKKDADSSVATTPTSSPKPSR